MTSPENLVKTRCPLGKLIRTSGMLLYDVKSNKDVHTWSVAPESKIQRHLADLTVLKTEILPGGDSVAPL